MSQGPELSIVIPCYNELANLEHGCLQEVEEYLAGVNFTWEVIISNDGSTDGSGEFVQRWCESRDGWRAIDVEHGGKPVAVWGGIQAARGDVVLFTDMDQSTPLSEWELLRPYYALGYEVVIGSRGSEREGFSLLRKIGSATFRGIRRAMLLREVADTQCGFKSCVREAALRCFPKLQFFHESRDASGWTVSAYDVELLFLLERAGYRMAEVPVQWSNRDISETKNDVAGPWRYVHESREMLGEILRVRRNVSRGVYDD